MDFDFPSQAPPTKNRWIWAVAGLAVLVALGAAAVKLLPERQKPSRSEPEPAGHVVQQGRMLEVNQQRGQIQFAIAQGEDEGDVQTVGVPIGLKVSMNGQIEYQGRLLTLADLQPGDRVVVHRQAGTGRATRIDAYRVVPLQGTLREVDPQRGKIKLAVGNVVNPWIKTLPVSPDVGITLNGLRAIDGRPVRLSDLAPGDHAAVGHDTHVVRIDAHRMVSETAVIRRVRDEEPGTVEAVRRESGKPVTYRIPEVCKITLGGRPVGLTELRPGDVIDVAHDSVDSRTPALATLSANRPPDPGRRAVLIGIGQCDDALVPRLPYAAADARLLRETLAARYRVPEAQALLLADQPLARLRQGIAEQLAAAGPDDEVIVYFAGHGFRDADGSVCLAGRDFELSQMGETGLALAWLLAELEKCPAQHKLLLLDAYHAEAGPAAERQPSTAEMLAPLFAEPDGSPLKTVHAVASCRPGQRGLVSRSLGHGLFACALAEAYSGRGDENRDLRLEPGELESYLTAAMTSASRDLGETQLPQLFAPRASTP